LNKNHHLAVTSNGNKIKLRENAFKLRKDCSKTRINDFSKIIFDNLLEHFDFENKNIHLFFPIKEKNEVNTWYLYESINFKSTLHTSVFNEKTNLWECVKLSKTNEFKISKFNIPSPRKYRISKLSEIDYIIVPLLCFDRVGNRVGYGKGIYDKILNEISSNCKKIGVSILECSEIKIDSEQHDVQLDYCQTPTKLYRFQ